jgi:hypothetical protein
MSFNASIIPVLIFAVVLVIGIVKKVKFLIKFALVFLIVAIIYHVLTKQDLVNELVINLLRQVFGG